MIRNLFLATILTLGAVSFNTSVPDKVNAQTTCSATDAPSLSACVAQSNVVVELLNDIEIASGGCPTIMLIQNRNNVTVNGNGHYVKRTNQSEIYNCSLVDIINSDNITLNDIRLDDDETVPSCPVGACSRMVHIRNGSDNISFYNTDILNGKDYVVYINGGSNFTMEDSKIINSGIIGLYVGGGVTNALIMNNVITDTEVNGIAVLDASNVVIKNNYFENNHRNGKFAVAPQFGDGFTGGGQVYIAEGSNIDFFANTVINGGQTCPVNCRGGVHGVEISVPNQAAVFDVDLRGNTIENHTSGSNIYVNQGAVIDGVSDLSNAPGGFTPMDLGGNEIKVEGEVTIDETINGSGTIDPPPQECTNEDSVITLQAESGTFSGSGWSTESAVAGAENGQYIVWRGANNFVLNGTNPVGIATYTVNITTPGTYIFTATTAARIGNTGGASDADNDAYFRWLSGTNPSSATFDSSNWTKFVLFGNKPPETWHPYDAGEPSPSVFGQIIRDLPVGTHTFQVGGRSQRYAIDTVGVQLLNAESCDPTASGTGVVTNPDADTVAIILNYDIAPDRDDLQAIAANGSLVDRFLFGPNAAANNASDGTGLDINNTALFVNLGTYGENRQADYESNTNGLGQGPNGLRYQMAQEVADDAYPAGLINNTAFRWNASVEQQAQGLLPILQAGGSVKIAEGGPSDFTYEVLQRLIVLGIPLSTIQTKVTVVQHSAGFNQQETNAGKLSWVQNNTIYQLIDNGNIGGNSTADLADTGTGSNTLPSFRTKMETLGQSWVHAFDYFSNKVDFSDTVELLHILNISLSTVNDIPSFGNFVD